MNDSAPLESIGFVSELSPRIPLMTVGLCNGTPVKTSLQLYIESAIHLYHSDPSETIHHRKLIDRIDYAVGRTLMDDPDDPTSQSNIIAWLYATLQTISLSFDDGLSREEQIDYILSLTPAHLLEQLCIRTIQSMEWCHGRYEFILCRILLQMGFLIERSEFAPFFANLSNWQISLILDVMQSAWKGLSTRVGYRWRTDPCWCLESTTAIFLRAVGVPGTAWTNVVHRIDAVSAILQSTLQGGSSHTASVRQTCLAARLLTILMKRITVDIRLPMQAVDWMGLQAFLTNMLRELDDDVGVIGQDLHVFSRCTVLFEKLITASLYPLSTATEPQQLCISQTILSLVMSFGAILFPTARGLVPVDIQRRLLRSVLSHSFLAEDSSSFLRGRLVEFLSLMPKSLFDPREDEMVLTFLDTVNAKRCPTVELDGDFLKVMLPPEHINSALLQFPQRYQKLIMNEINWSSSEERKRALGNLLLKEYADANSECDKKTLMGSTWTYQSSSMCAVQSLAWKGPCRLTQ